MAQRTTYGYIVQPIAGMVTLTGEPERIRIRCAGAVANYGTGL